MKLWGCQAQEGAGSAIIPAPAGVCGQDFSVAPKWDRKLMISVLRGPTALWNITIEFCDSASVQMMDVAG